MDEAEYFEAFRDFFADVKEEKNFLNFLDVELIEVKRGHVELHVPTQPYLFNPAGVVHGAVTAGLVDMACGLSIRAELGPPRTSSFQTVDLNVSYVRPATEDLHVEGSVVRAGEHLGVGRAEVRSLAPDETEKTVVSGQATYYYD